MIHRIRIQNFKSLRDVTVDLSPVTVLVGKSGTGKSNFVSAIRFFRNFLAREVNQNPDVQAWPTLRCATCPSRAPEMEIEFAVPAYEEQFTYQLRLDPDRIQHAPLLESLSYGDRVLFRQESNNGNPLGGLQGGAASKWLTEPALVVVPQAGPMAIRRLPGIEEVSVAYIALTRGIGVYAFPYNVLTMREQHPARGNGAEGLGEIGEGFLPVVREINSNVQNLSHRRGIAAALRQINPSVVSVELDSIHAPKTAYVGHKLGEKTLPLELCQESDGFRRFYAHLLALYQTPPKQTLLFEEPENGIYMGALSLLADEFKAAPDAGRGQVILTTHSPALLDHLSAEEIRVVELVDLETQIGPIALEQKAALAEQLLYPGELLTADPARLEAAAE